MKTNFHNCIIPYKYEIKENYVAWLPYSYMINFRDEIVPKFLNKAVANNKRERWQNHIDAYVPKTFLGYASEETFLDAKQLTPKDIVLNSLKYIFNDELDTDSYEMLTDSFIELLSAEKNGCCRHFYTFSCFFLKLFFRICKTDYAPINA